MLFLAVLFAFVSNVVARPHNVSSDSMAPTLDAGERIIITKFAYQSRRMAVPRAGDMVVFTPLPGWNTGYTSIRSQNTALRWLQNAVSFFGFAPPDEKYLVSRVLAVGGETIECRRSTGITVNREPIAEPYLGPKMLDAEPPTDPCFGPEFGPVRVPTERLWVMGDNRTHATDSRAHCESLPADLERGIACTGDPMSGTVPMEDVIGKAQQFW
ncbi:signal peptidase I [Mycobacterium sp. NPDC051804]|uniref:signal peptidase I n=1 Tax=Mycobacterium sp. NPDC051804 TaxID=3364295 RepID=UPI0037879636